MINLCGMVLALDAFEWVEDTSKFNKDFIENYNEDSEKEYFLKLMFNFLENYIKFKMI